MLRGRDVEQMLGQYALDMVGSGTGLITSQVPVGKSEPIIVTLEDVFVNYGAKVLRIEAINNPYAHQETHHLMAKDSLNHGFTFAYDTNRNRCYIQNTRQGQPSSQITKQG